MQQILRADWVETRLGISIETATLAPALSNEARGFLNQQVDWCSFLKITTGAVILRVLFIYFLKTFDSASWFRQNGMWPGSCPTVLNFSSYYLKYDVKNSRKCATAETIIVCYCSVERVNLPPPLWCMCLLRSTQLCSVVLT